jgi:hypothetical protein
MLPLKTREANYITPWFASLLLRPYRIISILSMLKNHRKGAHEHHQTIHDSNILYVSTYGHG